MRRIKKKNVICRNGGGVNVIPSLGEAREDTEHKYKDLHLTRAGIPSVLTRRTQTAWAHREAWRWG